MTDTTAVHTGTICVIGDVHGHLQLGLCMAARWQRELGVRFEAVLVCGDVGTFTDDSQLDNATRQHARANPCELEFLTQWSTDPQAKWLGNLFAPVDRDGLGLECPVVMVHGNHEGFSHLASLVPAERPVDPVAMRKLPAVDTAGHIRYLPSGWKCRTSSGLVVAGVGGIERGQREAEYHPLAYLDDEAILQLLEDGDDVDILITHQGPSAVQGEKTGSRSLQELLDAEVARAWFHGHSIPNPAISRPGQTGKTVVVPLKDIAFSCKGLEGDDPGVDGWCVATFDKEITLERARPTFWREYRKRLWKETKDSLLVSPDLAETMKGTL